MSVSTKSAASDVSVETATAGPKSQTRWRLLQLQVLLLLGLTGCATTQELSVGCGVAAGGMYRPVVNTSINYAAGSDKPTGLIFGSIGSLGDFDQRALRWEMYLARDPDRYADQRAWSLRVTHFHGVTVNDFDLFTPRPGRKPPGAALFCVSVEPGEYEVRAVRVQSAALPLPAALQGANAAGAVKIGHRFTVPAGTAVYLGQFVVGSAGLSTDGVGQVFVTNEVGRDTKKARELAVKLDTHALRLSVPTPAAAASPIRNDIPTSAR